MDAIGLAAWITALLGDADHCQQFMDQATAMSVEMRMTAPGGLARGMLALSQGRYQDAARAFESKSVEMPLNPVAQALGLRPYVPAQVEAYARAGRTDDAARLLDSFYHAALATGQPRHAAPAMRAKGVLEDRPQALDQALHAHEAWGNRFEEARTLLARGEILRRRGRREGARTDLRAAAERFEQVGAAAWRDRAVTELRAAGDRSVAVRTALGRGPEKLTQQEAAVATLAVEGLTNRQIADRLFISVKTVEGHLTTIYGKLGLASRAQLIASGIEPSSHGSIG
jgi:DNA-binding CsgD family transcriptional regulator